MMTRVGIEPQPFESRVFSIRSCYSLGHTAEKNNIQKIDLFLVMIFALA